MAILVYYIWVGQGDCTLIRTATNKLILIDCGTSDNMSIWDENVEPTIKQIMKDAGNKKIIDYLFLTHSDKDHCNLIPKFSNFTKFNQVWYGGAAWEYKKHKVDFDNGNLYVKVNNITDHFINFTSTILSETDLTLRLIAGNYPYKKDPPATPYGKDINKPSNRTNKTLRSIYDNNGNSLVSMLAYGTYRTTFLGDATIVEQDFIDTQLQVSSTPNLLNSSMLKLSHHGSGESYSEDFTSDSVKPKGVIASAGITFGHPDYAVIDAISTIAGTVPKHDYMAFDRGDDAYDIYKTKQSIFNTNFKYSTSSISAPTHTTTGKRKRDAHAGELYTALDGYNVYFIINANKAAVGYDPHTTILTTKSTSNVKSKKRKKTSSITFLRFASLRRIAADENLARIWQ